MGTIQTNESVAISGPLCRAVLRVVVAVLLISYTVDPYFRAGLRGYAQLD